MGRPRQTYCKRGHLFTPETTRVTRAGRRYCVLCHRMRQMRYYGRRKQAGICVHCANPAVPGKTMCEEHLRAKARKSLRCYHERRIAVEGDNG